METTKSPRNVSVRSLLGPVKQSWRQHASAEKILISSGGRGPKRKRDSKTLNSLHRLPPTVNSNACGGSRKRHALVRSCGLSGLTKPDKILSKMEELQKVEKKAYADLPREKQLRAILQQLKFHVLKEVSSSDGDGKGWGLVVFHPDVQKESDGSVDMEKVGYSYTQIS